MVYLNCTYTCRSSSDAHSCCQNATKNNLIRPLKVKFYFPNLCCIYLCKTVTTTWKKILKKNTVLLSHIACKEYCGVYLTHLKYGLRNNSWAVLQRQISSIDVCLATLLCYVHTTNLTGRWFNCYSMYAVAWFPDHHWIWLVQSHLMHLYTMLS